MAFKDILEKHLTSDEIDKFGIWAFGENLHQINGSINFMNAWNELHSEDLLLKYDSKPDDDIPKMIDIWRKHIEL